MNAKLIGLGAALLVVVVGVVLALSGGDSETAPTQAAKTIGSASSFLVPAAERKQVAALAGATNDGKEFSTGSLKGEPYLVHVWASWCPICADEAPSLSKLLKQNADVKVVGVNVEDSPADAANFQESNDLNFHADLKDDNRELENQLGLTGQPNTVVVDAKGNVAATFVGAVNGQDLQSVLDSVKSE